MSRRRDDEDDAGVSQRSNGPFGGVPGWLKLATGPGLAIVLVFWLLGAFPWMPSPIGDIKQSLADTKDTLVKHEASTRQLLHTNVLICRGIWREHAEMQRQCEAGNAGP